MKVLALGAFVLTAGLYATGLVRALVSIRWPEHRKWPPADGASPSTPLRQRAQSLATSLGVPLVGLLDWDSFAFSNPARFAVAVVLIACGAMAGRAHRHLGPAESLGRPPPGRELSLRTDGPYARTRNPQYLGAVPVYLGVAIGTNSLLALIAAMLMIAMLVAMVFAEESWMRDRFGEAYEDYCQSVPRFLPHALNPFRQRSGARRPTRRCS